MDTAREPNLENFARDATGFAVLTPEDPAYDGSTEIWNGSVTARPRVLVRATRAEHVQEALRIAAQSNMPVSVKSGGHDWAGRALAAGGLTVDLSAMREVRIDVDRRLARLGGGARLADVVDAAGAHGLAAATGTYSDVGYTGWAIGGGYGPLGGIVGLGADTIVEAQLVTADGSIVTASQQQDADLLWAIRGGGGNFGVVTELTVRLHPLPEVAVGAVMFGADQMQAALARLDSVLDAAPGELSVQPAIMAGDDGSPSLTLSLTWAGTFGGEADHWFGRLAGLGTPATRFDVTTPSEALHALDGQFPNGLHYVIRTADVAAISPAVAAALTTAAHSSSTGAISLHRLHGAATRVAAHDTPFALRDKHYMVEIIGIAESAEGLQAQRSWADSVLDDLQPHILPAGYVNLLAPEETARAAAAYDGNLERLLAVKRRLDPNGLFQATPFPLHR